MHAAVALAVALAVAVVAVILRFSTGLWTAPILTSHHIYISSFSSLPSHLCFLCEWYFLPKPTLIYYINLITIRTITYTLFTRLKQLQTPLACPRKLTKPRLTNTVWRNSSTAASRSWPFSVMLHKNASVFREKSHME
jgi:hypothetical protein